MPSSDLIDDPTAEYSDSVEGEQPQSGFANLGLSPAMLEVITGMGFETPTPIQEAAIPVLMAGRDVVGIAQTGTGKTAAFGLPLVEMIDPNNHSVQSLVLAPTRELALQSAKALEDFAVGLPIEVVAVYGGSPYGPQLKALRQGAQIVVGTPGRVIDLIEKNALDLSGVQMLVLDEADEMLRMGFAEDVETITSSAGKDRLTALFSATMPRTIERVAKTHLNDPVRLEVSTQASTVDTIHQTYAVVPQRFRFEALTRALATHTEGATIVFVKTRQDAEEISLDLTAAGFKASGISGDVAQRDRERLVERLRGGTLNVLVATDVAARGLDVERISLVVNYDVPRETDSYVHRVGRTGRAGRDGEALTFFGPKDQYRLRQIERLTGTRLDKVEIPTRDEVTRLVAQKKLDSLLDLSKTPDLAILETALAEALERGHNLEEIALRLLAETTGMTNKSNRRPKGHGFGGETDASGNFLGSGFDGPDKRGKKMGGRDDKPRSRRREGGSYGHRYRVEVGKRDGVSPGAIVGAITGEGGVGGDSLGKIDIFPAFSLVEMSEDLSPSQLNKIGRATVSGRRLRIAQDNGSSPSRRGGGSGNFKPRDKKRSKRY